MEHLNRMLRGWAQYFCLGPLDKAYRAIHAHTTQRLRRWLGTKHKSAVQGSNATLPPTSTRVWGW
ncbi:MAG: group II intron maturase-specific domain-containing protein [Chromatiales bacterium]